LDAAGVRSALIGGLAVGIRSDPLMDPSIRRAEPITLGDRTIHVVRTDDLIEMKGGPQVQVEPW
jgi:hypothetical protein